MSLLESVIAYLIKKSNAIVRSIEQTDGAEKLIKILGERESGPETADTTQQANVAQEIDATARALYKARRRR